MKPILTFNIIYNGCSWKLYDAESATRWQDIDLQKHRINNSLWKNDLLQKEASGMNLAFKANAEFYNNYTSFYLYVESHKNSTPTNKGKFIK